MCIICSSKALQCHEPCALSKPAHGIMGVIHLQTAKAQSRGCIRADSPESLHIYSMELDEGLDQESDI